jgi:hypothetical protein
MSEEKQSTRPQDSDRRNNPENRQDDTTPHKGDTVVPAIHHVGKTLESDPDYIELPSSGYSTPEAQIAAEAGSIDVDQRRMQEDDFDPLSGKSFEDRSERLKTRLPGDTSSDPHSDVGPDNATDLQSEPDIRGSAERRTKS